jgi:hypothetical protein
MSSIEVVRPGGRLANRPQLTNSKQKTTRGSYQPAIKHLEKCKPYIDDFNWFHQLWQFYRGMSLPPWDPGPGYKHPSLATGSSMVYLEMADLSVVYLIGGFNPSEKYESQLGWIFPIYGKIKNVPNHQPVMINSSRFRGEHDDTLRDFDVAHFFWQSQHIFCLGLKVPMCLLLVYAPLPQSTRWR